MGAQLKSIEDALTIRRRVFGAFEMAETASDPAELSHWLTFVLAATGVKQDRVGRITVGDVLTIPGHPEIMVTGDVTSLDKLPASPRSPCRPAFKPGCGSGTRSLGGPKVSRFVYIARLPAPAADKELPSAIGTEPSATKPSSRLG